MNYRSLPLVILGLLALAACTPSSPHGGNQAMHTQPQGMAALGALDLRFQKETPLNPSDIAFSIREGDKFFTDYGISQTKEMHFIAVRDDLRYFQHVHPGRDSKGVWHVNFQPEAGGTYWLFADFVDSTGKTYTLRSDREFTGETGEYGLAKDLERVKTVDGYRIEVVSEQVGKEVSFTYHITDSSGKQVALEEYLGAKGHSVLISPSKDFIHTHPSDDGDTPMFTTTLPPDPYYRAFTQFKINGKVVTVDFDWQQ